MSGSSETAVSAISMASFGAANRQIRIGKVIADRRIERIGLARLLVGRDRLFVAAKRIIGRRLLVERLGVVGEALEELARDR